MFEKFKEWWNQPNYEEQLSQKYILLAKELEKELKEEQEKFENKLKSIDNMSDTELLRLIAKEICILNSKN